MSARTAVDELLDRVRAFGGELVPVGPDLIKVRAPAPLPDDLMAELRQHKPELLAALGVRRPYRFALRDGGGVYITEARTLEDAERELMAFYGDRLMAVGLN
jgi:hypothetical protein